MVERIKTADQAVADAEKALLASQSELRNAKKALDASGFSVDSYGIFSLDWDASNSLRQVRDKHVGTLEKQNEAKLQESELTETERQQLAEQEGRNFYSRVTKLIRSSTWSGFSDQRKRERISDLRRVVNDGRAQRLLKIREGANPILRGSLRGAVN